MEYKFDDIIKIGKRYNNKKRAYLLINQIQAKHIPTHPSDIESLIKILAEKVNKETKGRAIVIGFAETATAISTILASSLDDAFYLQTTREDLKNENYLIFSELHSHAVVQKIYVDALIKEANNYDTIVIMDDEITTGKTVINLVNKLKEVISLEQKKIILASIINRVSPENKKVLEENGISLVEIFKEEYSEYEFVDQIEAFSPKVDYQRIEAKYSYKEFRYVSTPRLGVDIKSYLKEVKENTNNLLEGLDLAGKNVLVLGTEEYMYQALDVARKINERYGIRAVTHSTTRSPIMVSTLRDYPIYNGYQIASPYDSQRTTYIYDINKYDVVILVTDGRRNIDNFVTDISSVLALNDCQKTHVFVGVNDEEFL